MFPVGFFSEISLKNLLLSKSISNSYVIIFYGFSVIIFFNYIPLELCSATFLEPSLEIILKIYMNFENPSDIALGNSLGNCFRNQSSNFYEMVYYHLQQFIDSLRKTLQLFDNYLCSFQKFRLIVIRNSFFSVSLFQKLFLVIPFEIAFGITSVDVLDIQ